VIRSEGILAMLPAELTDDGERCAGVWLPVFERDAQHDLGEASPRLLRSGLLHGASVP
jgi:hypothetical protein